jgi:hypothetical protein
MTYQDPTWSGDFDDFILAGKAFVRGLRSNNMPSLYRLAKKFEMSARFIIRDPNIMQGTVIKSQPFMPGYFKIVHSSYLPGQLIVSKQSVTDIISRLHVPHTQLIGSVDMHRKADLLGKVIRKVPPEALDLEARINISRPHLLGLVSIVRSSYMQGKLNVAVAGRNDIQGKLGIIRSLLYGRYDSRPTSELIGSVAMQRQTDTNLIGNYTRIRSSLEGNVTVTIGADLQGKVYMKGFVHNVLQGSVLITKSSLLGKVEIVGTALSQFTGMFYVPYTSIMTGQVRVQRSEVEDITGSARIYIKAVNNMSGRLMIQLHSSLMGTMDVMQNSNLAGAVIKRVFDANDLNSLYFVTGALTRNYFRGRLNVKRTSSYLKGRYTVNTPARVVDTYRLGRLPRPWKRSDFL